MEYENNLDSLIEQLNAANEQSSLALCGKSATEDKEIGLILMSKGYGLPAAVLGLKAQLKCLIHLIDIGITGGTHVDAPERPKDPPARPIITIDNLKPRA